MNTNSLPTDAVAMMSLSKFCQHVGISDVTAWRWRKQGLLRTVNIYGRQYLTRASLDEFLRRAEAGEFAKVPAVPRKRNRESTVT